MAGYRSLLLASVAGFRCPDTSVLGFACGSPPTYVV